MKHLTALSDQNYILYGAALIESLGKSTIPWTLHYYCIDDTTYRYILMLRNPNVIAYKPEVLMGNGIRFPIPASQARLNTLKRQDSQYFCWSLASVFTDYIMNHVRCDSVTYIDSDIYFHRDIKALFDAFGTADVGIFRHRHFMDPNTDYGDGRYNVGVVYFKASEKGKGLLSWWADAVLFRRYPEYATCGDQKYLEFFPKTCSPSEIFIDGNIGHGASWQWEVYDLSKLKEKVVIWKGQEQELVFTHFSKFKYNLNDRSFASSWYKSDHIIYTTPDLYDLHLEYVDALARASTKLGGIHR